MREKESDWFCVLLKAWISTALENSFYPQLPCHLTWTMTSIDLHAIVKAESALYH